jgi:hypothetical protein
MCTSTLRVDADHQNRRVTKRPKEERAGRVAASVGVKAVVPLDDVVGDLR